MFRRDLRPEEPAEWFEGLNKAQREAATIWARARNERPVPDYIYMSFPRHFSRRKARLRKCLERIDPLGTADWYTHQKRPDEEHVPVILAQTTKCALFHWFQRRGPFYAESVSLYRDLCDAVAFSDAHGPELFGLLCELTETSERSLAELASSVLAAIAPGELCPDRLLVSAS